MTHFLVNKTTMQRARKGGYEIRCVSERAAKAMRTRLINKGELTPDYEAMDADTFHAQDPMVTVYSIHDLTKSNPIKIKQSDRGGCCDPSTERYWTM